MVGLGDVLLPLITTCSCVKESAIAVLALLILLMWGYLMVVSSNGVDPKLQPVLIVEETVLVLVGRSCVVGHPLPRVGESGLCLYVEA